MTRIQYLIFVFDHQSNHNHLVGLSESPDSSSTSGVDLGSPIIPSSKLPLLPPPGGLASSYSKHTYPTILSTQSSINANQYLESPLTTLILTSFANLSLLSPALLLHPFLHHNDIGFIISPSSSPSNTVPANGINDQPVELPSCTTSPRRRHLHYCRRC